MHILVGVSSIDPDIPHDDTCVFKGGEHEFIKHPSFATYEFAIQRHKNFIDDKAKKRVYKRHKDATSALVAKISAGEREGGSDSRERHRGVSHRGVSHRAGSHQLHA